MAEFPLIETADGSLTAFNPHYGEHYHNLNGAWRETQGLYGKVVGEYFRVFNSRTITGITISDVGFGLGYNFLLAFQMLKESSFGFKNLFSFEKEDLANLPIQEIPFPEKLKASAQILKMLSNKKEFVLEKVRVHFLHGDIRSQIQRIPFESCNIWLWDPFSARKNPETWSLDLFRAVFGKSSPNSILITYAKSGYIRRALLKGGFEVFSLRNLGGKQEATLAIKGQVKKFIESPVELEIGPVHWENYAGIELLPLRDKNLQCLPEEILNHRNQRKIHWKKRMRNLS